MRLVVDEGGEVVDGEVEKGPLLYLYLQGVLDHPHDEVDDETISGCVQR